MSQENYTTGSEKKKYHHITEKDRYQIEALLKSKTRTSEIARVIGCSVRTIQREIKRGKVQQITSGYEFIQTYKADAAQRLHEERSGNKGRLLKIGKNHEYANRISELIIFEKFSPDAANALWRKEQGTKVICTRTLYNYIYSDLFVGLSAKHLPRGERPAGKKKKHRKVALNNTTARSIEERAEEVERREVEGHWEMDTVVGSKTKQCLLVLTERKSNFELVAVLKDRTSASVIHQLDIWERKLGYKRFKEIFKTITCDNGAENLDTEGLEKSAIGKGKRTLVYYAHPYSAYERGANEAANVLIRRFVPKGSAMRNVNKRHIKKVQTWINNYPRRKHNYDSAFESSEFAPVLQKFGVI